VANPAEPPQELSEPVLDPTDALAHAVERVGDRWTLLLVHALLDAPQRFSDLERTVPGISPNVLSQRLKQLEADGLVVATPYSERPPRFTYELSATGRDLAGPLRLLAQWGAEHAGRHGLRHAACGTPVEARWWCPTCEVAVDDNAVSDLDHL
jgi:DNA-binding HxlR family transcriptional regulator